MEDKQIMIVRKSSLKVAQEFLCCKLGDKYSATELIKTSELLTDYVMKGYTDDVKKRTNNLDKYLKEKI